MKAGQKPARARATRSNRLLQLQIPCRRGNQGMAGYQRKAETAEPEPTPEGQELIEVIFGPRGAATKCARQGMPPWKDFPLWIGRQPIADLSRLRMAGIAVQHF